MAASVASFLQNIVLQFHHRRFYRQFGLPVTPLLIGRWYLLAKSVRIQGFS